MRFDFNGRIIDNISLEMPFRACEETK